MASRFHCCHSKWSSATNQND